MRRLPSRPRSRPNGAVRDELLAALRVDELAQRAPTPEEIAVLRVGELGDAGAVGPRLARERANGRDVEARLLYAPDGAVLARFYFEPGADDAAAAGGRDEPRRRTRSLDGLCRR